VRVVEVLECLGLSLVCGRVGDDGNVMATQPVRPALRLLPGQATCMAANCCSCMPCGFVRPHASVATLVPCIWAHVPVGARLLVRGGDLSWPRLVVRGGDLSWLRLVVRGGDLSLSGTALGAPLNNWGNPT
jgi:hypothetical protein